MVPMPCYACVVPFHKKELESINQIEMMEEGRGNGRVNGFLRGVHEGIGRKGNDE